LATTLSNIVQNILTELGQTDPVFGLFDATGGSATTFINTNFANYENPPDQDAFNNHLVVVVRDSAGAGASPEGRWAICSAYNDSTNTGTIATVTDAIASGDTIMIAKQDKFPIDNIKFAINRGLEFIGDVPLNSNESLTTVSQQTEYNVPVAVKRGLKQVWVEYSEGFWEEITDRRNELTTGGTASKLFLPTAPAGLTIRLVYDGPHPVVNAYSDVINEYIHPKVITCAAIIKLLEWYNRRTENADPSNYYVGLEAEYRTIHLPLALAENPIQRPEKAPRNFVLGRGSPRYSRYGPQLAE
jgi:hypothetical protein